MAQDYNPDSNSPHPDCIERPSLTWPCTRWTLLVANIWYRGMVQDQVPTYSLERGPQSPETPPFSMLKKPGTSLETALGATRVSPFHSQVLEIQLRSTLWQMQRQALQDAEFRVQTKFKPEVRPGWLPFRFAPWDKPQEEKILPDPLLILVPSQHLHSFMDSTRGVILLRPMAVRLGPPIGLIVGEGSWLSWYQPQIQILGLQVFDDWPHFPLSAPKGKGTLAHEATRVFNHAHSLGCKHLPDGPLWSPVIQRAPDPMTMPY